MKIDRSNYEIWFIDWLDGNLDDDQAELFRLFLSANPDLKEELNDLADIRIIPPSIDFSGKRMIKKAPSDISDLQFEYLCAAYIENDLTKADQIELSEITSVDPDRQKMLELFKKLKLAPSVSVCKNKKKLLKRTPVQKVIRMSVAGLSAAASIAIMIISYFLISGNERDIKENLSQLMINEGRVVHSRIVQQAESPVRSKSQSFKEKYSDIRPAVENKPAIRASYPEKEDINIEEPVSIPSYIAVIKPVEIPGISDAIHSGRNGIRNYELIPLSFSYPIKSEERWAGGRFFAKTFREKILREHTNDDSPIKGYEIAEAGVAGLNKLLGWQMAFNRNNDENGEIKSVYFNSKLLKIQAPVNKSESTE